MKNAIIDQIRQQVVLELNFLAIPIANAIVVALFVALSEIEFALEAVLVLAVAVAVAAAVAVADFQLNLYKEQNGMKL